MDNVFWIKLQNHQQFKSSTLCWIPRAGKPTFYLFPIPLSCKSFPTSLSSKSNPFLHSKDLNPILPSLQIILPPISLRNPRPSGLKSINSLLLDQQMLSTCTSILPIFSQKNKVFSCSGPNQILCALGSMCSSLQGI